jgi:Cu-Zn family superoxide dismutase
MKSLYLATAIIAFPIAAIAGSHGAMPKPVTVPMKGVDGADHGTVTLTQMKDVVLLHADMKNVPEGGHGFHIHETGKCAPDFAAAGDHYNPKGKDHGFAGDGPHAGDMANVYAMANGRILADVLNPRVSLFPDSDVTLFDEDGSAIILHEKPDSYGTKAGAGDRIACGVIER